MPDSRESETLYAEVCHACGLYNPVGRPRIEHAEGCVERRARSPYIQTKRIPVVPAEVTDDMVERAFNEFRRYPYRSTTDALFAVRRALTAALRPASQGERDADQ